VTNFYILQVPSNYKRQYAYPYGEHILKPRCEVCGRPPVVNRLISARVRFERRVTVADFVHSPPELLVTDKVKQVFERDQVNANYGEVEVRIAKTQEELRSKLWHVCVGRAHASPEMNIVAVNQCLTCGVASYSTWDNGVLIDESRWDGSDILRLYEDVVGILVTKKVRDIVEREGFTGVEFIPAGEYTDPYPESRKRLA